MFTFSGTISTKDGVVKDKKGGKGTIATKKTRDKNILTKDKKKEFASMMQDQVPKEAFQEDGLLSKISSGIGSLFKGGSNESVAKRNVTIPNQDLWGKEFKIGEVGGFTLESGPFGLGTSLHGPKHKLPEFLQQNPGALLQSALNAQRYGSGDIAVGSRDRTGNTIRDVITLKDYIPPATAQEFIDNIYQNPSSGIESLLNNNMLINALKGIGYAGTDKHSGLYQTGVSPALRSRGHEGFFNNVQSLMGIEIPK